MPISTGFIHIIERLDTVAFTLILTTSGIPQRLQSLWFVVDKTSWIRRTIAGRGYSFTTLQFNNSTRASRSRSCSLPRSVANLINGPNVSCTSRAQHSMWREIPDQWIRTQTALPPPRYSPCAKAWVHQLMPTVEAWRCLPAWPPWPATYHRYEYHQ